MATIQFYQKPGCATNARQKRMLEAAGHTVIAKSLITEPWTAEALRGFFEAMPMQAWFNPASPRIRSGEIVPEKLDTAGAIAHMLDDPLLIRRPLVVTDGQRCAGFDNALIASLLGERTKANLEACSRPQASTPGPDSHLPPKFPSR